MLIKLIRLVLVAGAVIVAGHLQSRGATASQDVGTIAKKMFTALEKGEFEQFVADGDNTWRRLQRNEFERLTALLGPKLKGGYELSYLGEIKRSGGIQQTLWKLTMSSNGEEFLANIDFKEGKVARFGIPRI